MKTLSPNNLGKNLLVENCRKIKIKDFLRECRNKLKEVNCIIFMWYKM